jgi:hypothetical protein
MKPSVTVSPPPPPLSDFPPQADAPSANVALTATTPASFVILLRKVFLPSNICGEHEPSHPGPRIRL